MTAADIQALIDAAEAAGGGLVELPPGEISIPRPLEIGSRVVLRGAGRGVTVLRAAPGCDCDVIRTRNFAAMHDRACLSGGPDCPGEAPRYFAVKDLTIDGNYLDRAWNDPAAQIVNRRGTGLRLYGRLFDIDVEVRNMAEHAIYMEATGARGSDGVYARVRVRGRVFGKEALVFRGPGDIRLEEVVLGLCGLLPRPEADRTLPRSDWFPDMDGVDGIVIDGRGAYEGNVEIGFAHVYACFHGVGLRTHGVSRLEAEHLVSESNRGGVALSSRTYGAIGTLSVRNNGRRHPNLRLNAPPGLPGLLLAAGSASSGMVVSAFYCFRSVASQASDGWPCALVDGDNHTLTIYHRNSFHPETDELRAGPAVVVNGSGNVITANLSRVHGDGIILTGSDNLITVAARGGHGGAAVVRDARGQGRGGGNMIVGTVRDCPVAFRSLGTPDAEQVDLNVTLREDQHAFCGTCAPSDNTARWRFSGRIGTTPVEDVCHGAPSCAAAPPMPPSIVPVERP